MKNSIVLILVIMLWALATMGCTPPATEEEKQLKDKILQINCQKDDSHCLDMLPRICSEAVLLETIQGKNTVMRVYKCTRTQETQ